MRCNGADFIGKVRFNPIKNERRRQRPGPQAGDQFAQPERLFLVYSDVTADRGKVEYQHDRPGSS